MAVGGIGITAAAPTDGRRRWLVLATMTGPLSMIMIDQRSCRWRCRRCNATSG
jgi:hypothetical protein